MPIAKLAILALGLVLAFFIGKRVLRNAKRKRLFAATFPEEFKQIVCRNVPLYNRLPDSLKEQLHGLVSVFISETKFEGCGQGLIEVCVWQLGSPAGDGRAP